MRIAEENGGKNIIITNALHYIFNVFLSPSSSSPYSTLHSSLFSLPQLFCYKWAFFQIVIFFLSTSFKYIIYILNLIMVSVVGLMCPSKCICLS